MNKKVTITKINFLMVIAPILVFFDATSMQANTTGAFPKLSGILVSRNFQWIPVKNISAQFGNFY